MESDGGSRWFGWVAGIGWKSRLHASEDGGTYIGPDGIKVTPWYIPGILRRENLLYVSFTLPQHSGIWWPLRFKSSGCVALLTVAMPSQIHCVLGYRLRRLADVGEPGEMPPVAQLTFFFLRSGVPAKR